MRALATHKEGKYAGTEQQGYKVCKFKGAPKKLTGKTSSECAESTLTRCHVLAEVGQPREVLGVFQGANLSEAASGTQTKVMHNSIRHLDRHGIAGLLRFRILYEKNVQPRFEDRVVVGSPAREGF